MQEAEQKQQPFNDNYNYFRSNLAELKYQEELERLKSVINEYIAAARISRFIEHDSFIKIRIDEEEIEVEQQKIRQEVSA